MDRILMDLDLSGCLFTQVSWGLIIICDGTIFLHNPTIYTKQVFPLTHNWTDSSVTHMTMPACRPISIALWPFQAQEREVKFRVYAYSPASICGGYLKCTGALLPAPFEGLNEGLKGWMEHFSQCVCACTWKHFSRHVNLWVCVCVH